MKNAYLLGLTAATATLFTACLFSGETNNTGRASVGLEIKASASTSTGALAKASGLILGDTAGVHVDLSDAKLVISRIKLESENGSGSCDSTGNVLKKEGEPGDTSGRGSEVENEKEMECEDGSGLVVIDLLTGVSSPDLGTLSVPAGLYNEVKFELHHGQNDSTLGGRTLVAHGTLTLADGSSKPFSLALTLDENLKIRSDSGLNLSAGALQTVAVKLMAGDWLKGLDLSACLNVVDPAAASIDITEDSPVGKCLDAEHRIKDNFRSSFHAGEKDEHETEGTESKDSTDDSGKTK
ncbi:MAG: hypothetical protein JF616_10685 [Fibrobacteres bacterium]|nr:hypothetical protein [Fibrobacterota bacterium]